MMFILYISIEVIYFNNSNMQYIEFFIYENIMVFKCQTRQCPLHYPQVLNSYCLKLNFFSAVLLVESVKSEFIKCIIYLVVLAS